MTDTDTKPHVEEAEPEIKVVDRRWWAQAEQGTQERAGPEGGAEQARFELRKPTYVEDLERQLAEKDKQLQDTIGRYKEAAREFDAVKTRIRRDVVKDVERGKGAILAELLDVVDNLDRAIDAARQAPGLKAGSPTPDDRRTAGLKAGSPTPDDRRTADLKAGSPTPDDRKTADLKAGSPTPVDRGTAGLQTGGDRLLEGVEMVRDQFLAKLEGLGLKRMAPLGNPFDPARHEAVTVVPVADASQDDVVLGIVREGYEFNGEVLRPALVAVGQTR